MKKESKGNNTLIYIVAGVFLVQIAVWGAWLMLAEKNKPKEVPLKTAPATKSAPAKP